MSGWTTPMRNLITEQGGLLPQDEMGREKESGVDSPPSPPVSPTPSISYPPSTSNPVLLSAPVCFVSGDEEVAQISSPLSPPISLLYFFFLGPSPPPSISRIQTLFRRCTSAVGVLEPPGKWDP